MNRYLKTSVEVEESSLVYPIFGWMVLPMVVVIDFVQLVLDGAGQIHEESIYPRSLQAGCWTGILPGKIQ